METFALKSSLDDSKLEFHGRTPQDRDCPIESYWVAMTRHDLSANTQVYAGYGHFSPTEFFHNMAERWRDWPGELEWSALEGELKLSASNDRRGHIALRLMMRPAISGDFRFDWLVQAFIMLDAGQLEAIARASARFFGRADV